MEIHDLDRAFELRPVFGRERGDAGGAPVELDLRVGRGPPQCDAHPVVVPAGLDLAVGKCPGERLGLLRGHLLDGDHVGFRVVRLPGEDSDDDQSTQTGPEEN